MFIYKAMAHGATLEDDYSKTGNLAARVRPGGHLPLGVSSSLRDADPLMRAAAAQGMTRQWWGGCGKG